jgi:hypothetical protein
LQIGAQTARYVALQSKYSGDHYTAVYTHARKAGMNTLIDMAQVDIPFN